VWKCTKRGRYVEKVAKYERILCKKVLRVKGCCRERYQVRKDAVEKETKYERML
jgi:hypothetical protein